MSRVKISFPDTTHFSTQIALRITDFNYGNHLANDSVLGVMHEARMQFFKSIHCTELDLFGSAIIMADVQVVYRAEGFYGDTLKVDLAISEINKYGFDIYYQGVALERNTEIFIAKTGIVCFNYSDHRIQKLPEAFSKIFN